MSIKSPSNGQKTVDNIDLMDYNVHRKDKQKRGERKMMESENRKYEVNIRIGEGDYQELCLTYMVSFLSYSALTGACKYSIR